MLPRPKTIDWTLALGVVAIVAPILFFAALLMSYGW
jgi:hypothetical protein